MCYFLGINIVFVIPRVCPCCLSTCYLTVVYLLDRPHVKFIVCSEVYVYVWRWGGKKGDRENFLFSLWGIMNMNVDWCSFLPRLTVVKAPVINRRQRQEELKGLKKRKEERKKKRADVVSRQLPLLFCQNHHGHVVGQTICCLCCCLCFYHISTPVHVCLYSLTSEG